MDFSSILSVGNSLSHPFLCSTIPWLFQEAEEVLESTRKNKIAVFKLYLHAQTAQILPFFLCFLL